MQQWQYMDRHIIGDNMIESFIQFEEAVTPGDYFYGRLQWPK